MSAKWTIGELRRYVSDRELDACREVVQYLIERGPRVVDWEDERDRCERCGKLDDLGLVEGQSVTPTDRGDEIRYEAEHWCAECERELSGDEP